MFKCEVEFREVKQPPHLSSVEIVRLLEIGQVFMVCEDLNQGGGDQKVMTPGVQCSHDHE